jgi:hypothetical protein
MATQKQLTIKNLFAALARTTTTTGSAVDLFGSINAGGRNMKAYLDVGTALGTTPSVTISIQESDNTTTFTDITGAAFAAVTTAAQAELHFRTNKRYVRGVATYTSNTTSATLGCYIVTEDRIS